MLFFPKRSICQISPLSTLISGESCSVWTTSYSACFSFSPSSRFVFDTGGRWWSLTLMRVSWTQGVRPRVGDESLFLYGFLLVWAFVLCFFLVLLIKKGVRKKTHAVSNLWAPTGPQSLLQHVSPPHWYKDRVPSSFPFLHLPLGVFSILQKP